MTDVSLIMCTRNRAKAMEQSLQVLAQRLQKVGERFDIEVVLVDNGSTDDTANVIERFSKTSPCKVISIREDRPGLAAARNAGLAHATGEVIAFTDDDCQLSEGYFYDLNENAKEMGATFIIGGRVDLGDSADLPITIKTTPVREDLDWRTSPAGFIHGCNMVFSRNLIDKVGLFDVRFGAGAAFKSGEDTDFVIRAFLAGVPVRYFPNMIVRHFHGRRQAAEATRLFRQYEYGTGGLLVKHGLKYPVLLKGFLFNMKDVMLEIVGRRSPIGQDTGVGRLEILKCHIKGACRYSIGR